MSAASDMRETYGLSEGFHERFLKAMHDVYDAYIYHGARSTKKLVPLHGWVISELQHAGLNSLDISGYGDRRKNKEKGMSGHYYRKKLDVTIQRPDGSIIGVISVKCIMGAYRKNSINYFEHLIGEIANLRRMDIVFGAVIIRMNNKRNTISKTSNIPDTVRDQDVHLYELLLNNGVSLAHAPDALAFCLVDVVDNKVIGLSQPPDLGMLDYSSTLLKERLNPEAFFNTMKLKLERATCDEHGQSQT